MLAADTLEALGVSAAVRDQGEQPQSCSMVIGSDRDWVNARCDRRLTVLRAIDKLDRLGADGVKLLLGPGRKDESGDFTKGAGFDPEQITVLGPVEFSNGRQQAGDSRSRPLLPGESFVSVNAVTSAGRLKRAARANGCRSVDCAPGTGPIECIDSSVVRGLEYYTGPVFEAELTFEVKNEDGQPVRFGSVGGGGRYDDLVARFTGEKVPATGFSIGVSRLQAALTALGRDTAAPARPRGRAGPGPRPHRRLPEDRAAPAPAGRRPAIRAELYLGSAGMKAQMKYADRRGAPCVVIQGGDERAKRRGADQGPRSRAPSCRRRSATPRPGARAVRRRSRCPKPSSSPRCAACSRGSGAEAVATAFLRFVPSGRRAPIRSPLPTRGRGTARREADPARPRRPP